MQTAKPTRLEPQTVEAFDAYIREAEAAMERTLHADGSFLWTDLSSERTRQVQEGQVAAQFWAGRAPVNVRNGLIHDSIGAALIPGTSIKKALALIQDYDNHKNIYKPEVIAYTTRIAEVHDAGSTKEKVLPPDTGYGFL